MQLGVAEVKKWLRLIVAENFAIRDYISIIRCQKAQRIALFSVIVRELILFCEKEIHK